MIQISLDSSCISKETIKPGGLLDLLLDLQKKGKVKLFTDMFVHMEKKKIFDGDSRDLVMDWIKINTTLPDTVARCNPNWAEDQKKIEIQKVRGYSENEFLQAMPIHKNLFPTQIGRKKRNSSYNDYRILMHAILQKHDYFLHNNPKDFDNEQINSKAQIEEAYKIKIRILNYTFLREIKEKINYSN